MRPLLRTFRVTMLAACITAAACVSPSSRADIATPVDGHTSPTWTIVHTLDHDVGVTVLAMSPSGTELAAGGNASGDVTVWNAESGTLLRRLTALNGTADALAYSPDGRWLAVGHTLICRKPSDRCVDVLEAGTDKVVQQLQTPPLPNRSPAFGYVAALQYSPDSKELAVAFTHGLIGFYEAGTGQLLRSTTLPAEFHGPVAYSPNGQYLAFGELQRTSGAQIDHAVIRLVDAHTGEIVRTLAGHADAIEALAFDPQGQFLASGTRTGTRTGTRFNEDPIRIWNVETGALVTELRGHTGKVPSLAFLQEGHALVSVSWDKTLKIWDVNKSTVLFTWTDPMYELFSVVVNAKETRMVSGGGGKKIRIWQRHP